MLEYYVVLWSAFSRSTLSRCPGYIWKLYTPHFLDKLCQLRVSSGTEVNLDVVCC